MGSFQSSGPGILPIDLLLRAPELLPWVTFRRSSQRAASLQHLEQHQDPEMPCQWATGRHNRCSFCKSARLLEMMTRAYDGVLRLCSFTHRWRCNLKKMISTVPENMLESQIHAFGGTKVERPRRAIKLMIMCSLFKHLELAECFLIERLTCLALPIEVCKVSAIDNVQKWTDLRLFPVCRRH